MWQCFVQFMKVICFTSLLVWDAKSDWAEEPVLLTPLESILELLLIFLQISSGFFVTRIFTVLDAYGLVAVIQLKLLRPENTGIPRWFLPVLIFFFFPLLSYSLRRCIPPWEKNDTYLSAVPHHLVCTIGAPSCNFGLFSATLCFYFQPFFCCNLKSISQ